MKHLGEYSSDRMRLSEARFVAQHPAPVLLHRRKGQEGASGAYKTTFCPPSTLVDGIRLSQALPSLGLLAGTNKDAADLLVYPLAKRPGAAFPERVSVGRTRATDLCLPTAQVSKCHAYFTMADGGARWLLTDNGSTNGTFLSGKRLAPEQPIEVRSGALIQFGDFQALFFTSTSLYGLLCP